MKEIKPMSVLSAKLTHVYNPISYYLKQKTSVKLFIVLYLWVSTKSSYIKKYQF